MGQIPRCTESISTLCLRKKVPTFKLSETFSNLNQFSKCLHCWKAYEICYKTHMSLLTTPFLQILCRYERKCKQIAFWVHRSFCRLWGEATKNIFSSIKKTKSVADYRNFWSRSLARFVRAAQFASVSSCARRLLKHFRRKFLDNPEHRRLMSTRLPWCLIDSPVDLQLVLLTQDWIINCLNVFFSVDTARSAADWPPINCACLATFSTAC